MSAVSIDLTQAVNRISQRVIDNSAFIQAIRSGLLSKESLKSYLSDIKWILGESIPHIKSAREAANRRGDLRLANFMEEKIAEEIGHDLWAENDLKRLNSTGKEPSPAAVRLMKFARNAALERPEFFVGYMIWSEAFTVVAGEQMSPYLPGNSLKTDDISAVYNHVETDKRHVQEDIGIAEFYFSEKEKREELISFIEDASKLTQAFLDSHVVTDRK
ncbi:MAG: hypothetical protein JNL01_03475 [Bdellovibrionales bacterium]|nr:hypothetical protein [Bdellovibrionales bacterium]